MTWWVHCLSFCFVSDLFLLLAAVNTLCVQIHICLYAEIMRFCGPRLSSPRCFIMQIPPCLRRHTLANVLCCFIIYRGFTQLSIFRLSRHCTTLHLVCMPAWWIMGTVVLWALCHSWEWVLPLLPRQSIRMQAEITGWLVILEQLAQPACRCLSALERIICASVYPLSTGVFFSFFFFYTAKEISQYLCSEQRQCDLLKGDLKVFVYLPMGHDRKQCI